MSRSLSQVTQLVNMLQEVSPTPHHNLSKSCNAEKSARA